MEPDGPGGGANANTRFLWMFDACIGSNSSLQAPRLAGIGRATEIVSAASVSPRWRPRFDSRTRGHLVALIRSVSSTTCLSSVRHAGTVARDLGFVVHGASGDALCSTDCPGTGTSAVAYACGFAMQVRRRAPSIVVGGNSERSRTKSARLCVGRRG